MLSWTGSCICNEVPPIGRMVSVVRQAHERAVWRAGMVLPELQRMLELLRATGADRNFSTSVLRRTSADKWQPTVRCQTCAAYSRAPANSITVPRPDRNDSIRTWSLLCPRVYAHRLLACVKRRNMAPLGCWRPRCDVCCQDPVPRHETTQWDLEQLLAQHADKQIIYIGADMHVTNLDADLRVRHHARSCSRCAMLCAYSFATEGELNYYRVLHSCGPLGG